MFKLIRKYILILKINKALGFKLNSQQVVYVFKNKDVFTSRVQGKTTAYIIKLLISEKEIDKRMLKEGYYSDREFGLSYNKVFEREFYLIERKLRRYGIKIARVV